MKTELSGPTLSAFGTFVSAQLNCTTIRLCARAGAAFRKGFVSFGFEVADQRHACDDPRAHACGLHPRGKELRLRPLFIQRKLILGLQVIEILRQLALLSRSGIPSRREYAEGEMRDSTFSKSSRINAALAHDFCAKAWKTATIPAPLPAGTTMEHMVSL
jgi:hypothetical protein